GGMRLQVHQEVVAGEERRAGVLERGRAGRPRAAVEQRELTEELARAHDRHEGLLPELTGERDLHGAFEHHVEVRARVVLAEDRLAPPEGLRPDALAELRQLTFGKPREERQPPKVFGYALLSHPRILWFQLDATRIMSGP